ncbi:MAG: Radical domain protein [Mucilaginibacter sp.]|nr:Radical domain protein [Mucilaginibacter sp.]
MIETYDQIARYRNANGFPPTICIQLLQWCNLTCANCRSDSSPNKKNEIDVNLLLSTLSNLYAKGSWRISLTGGEPFYYNGLDRLISHIHSLKFPFSITTNGFSSKTKFSAIDPNVWENGTLYVSIDGDKELHDSLRGKNSFEKAIDFLNYSRPLVKKLNVNTVLFSNPEDWAKDLYHELELIGVNNWTIISPVKKGRVVPWQIKEENYAPLYDIIKSVAVGRTTTSFLNFAQTDDKLTDIVFIDSDCTVRLPGYFDQILNSEKPISKIVNLYDVDVVEQIFTSVKDFISLENYIL